MNVRCWLASFAVCGALLTPACSKDEVVPDVGAETAPAQLSADATVTEKHGEKSVSWMITPEGTVHALVKGPGDQPIADAKGLVSVKPFGSSEKPKFHELEAKPGALNAEIGKLDADLTEVSYQIVAGGETLRGFLHVPPGGTAKLVASAKVAADSGVKAEEKGPHGGPIQVVGKNLVEVVGNEKTGEIRVYLLNDDRKVVAVEKQKVKVAIQGDDAEMIELKVAEKNTHFEGTLRHKTNPHKVTVVIEDAGETHVAIVGYRPATVIVVGPAAPRVAVFVVTSWDVVVVHDSPHVHIHDHHKHKHKKHGGGRGHVHIKF